MINIKFTDDESWDSMVSMGLEAANERLMKPFEAAMELYAFQKGFEACAEILKQQVIANQDLKKMVYGDGSQS